MTHQLPDNQPSKLRFLYTEDILSGRHNQDFWHKYKFFLLICGVIIISFVFFGLQFFRSKPSNSKSKDISITPTAQSAPTNTPTPTNKFGFDNTTKNKQPERFNNSQLPNDQLPPRNTTLTSTTTPTLTPTPTTSTSDNTPPNITSINLADNSTITTDDFCIALSVTDNVSSTSNIYYQYKFDSNDWTSWSTSGSSSINICFQNVSDGGHTFSFQAKDEANNVSITVTRSFTVDIP